jgi:hypothetical protein
MTRSLWRCRATRARRKKSTCTTQFHLETTAYHPQSFNWLQCSFCDRWRASFGWITADRALSCALGRKLSLAYVIYSHSNCLLIAVLRYRYEDSEDELPAGASDDDDDDSDEEEEDPEEEDGDVEGMRDLCLHPILIYLPASIHFRCWVATNRRQKHRQQRRSAKPPQHPPNQLITTMLRTAKKMAMKKTTMRRLCL